MGCSISGAAHQIMPAFGYAADTLSGVDLVPVDADNPLSWQQSNYPVSSSMPHINPSIDNLRVVCCFNERMVQT